MTRPASNPYRLYGALGSPYTLKVRAGLRRMQLPHVFVVIDELAAQHTASVKPALIPVLEHPDGRFEVDSTPMLQGLAARHPEAPALYPSDPAQAFLALLIEDFADEWLTKAMFHYRWAYGEDAALVSRQLIFDRLRSVGLEARQPVVDWFASRQRSRMALVGCTPDTAPFIEASFHRVIAALDAHVSASAPFMFGDVPCIADLAVFGQLSQLQRDPTPAGVMCREAPYAHRWVDWVDDASGFAGTIGRLEVAGPLSGLMREVGSVYLPFLQANSDALATGAEEFTVSLMGQRWTQAPFKYQGRCLDTLRTRYAALPPVARAVVDEALNDPLASAILG